VLRHEELQTVSYPTPVNPATPLEHEPFLGGIR
jgi:hypothetical protein